MIEYFCLFISRSIFMTELNLKHYPRSGDDADMAAINSENDLTLALYRHKIDQHNDTVIETGFCAFCQAPLESGKFCPADIELNYSCAAEFQREKDAKKRNGK